MELGSEPRHRDAFGKRTEILCALPRARCKGCEKVWTVPAPWEGKSKHFTKDFEAFTLTLMREMLVKCAGDILGESDTRLWRMLIAHVKAAHAATDFSGVVQVGVDEMNRRKGHNYLTVFADLAERRVLFATEGKDRTTFAAFAEELMRHDGHPTGGDGHVAMTTGSSSGSPSNRGQCRNAPSATVITSFLFRFLKGKAATERIYYRVSFLDVRNVPPGWARSAYLTMNTVMTKSTLICSSLLLAGLSLRGDGLPTLSVQVSGTLGYPDNVPGNLSSANYNNNQGPILGNSLSGSLAKTGSGSTSDNVSGASSFSVSASAAPGLLFASGAAQAQTAPDPILSPFVGGFATFFAQANFSDTVMVYNASLPLSAPVDVRMSLTVTWSGVGYADGNQDVTSVATSEMHFGGNGAGPAVIDSRYFLDGHPSDTAANAGGFFTLTVPNGIAQNVSGLLQIGGQAGLKGYSTSTVKAETFSDVPSLDGALFNLDGVLPGTLITADSGHDYSSVPEPATYGVAGGLLLIGWGLIRRGRGIVIED